MYDFDSVDAMEAAWIEWLKPAPVRKPEIAPKDEKPELIPPTKLPTPARR